MSEAAGDGFASYMIAHNDLDRAKQAARRYMEANYPGRRWWIAGGALRDTDHVVQFKDVDIFVNGFETDPEPEFGDELFDEPMDRAADRNAYLMRALTVIVDGVTLNLIFMRTDQWTAESIAERCDFGLNQISWCPDTDHTYRSEQYLLDFQHRTLTNTRATAPERHDRMKSKFPGYRVRNPRNLPFSTGGWGYSNGKVTRLT